MPVETPTHYQYPHHFHGTYTPPQGYPPYYSPLQTAPEDKSYITPFISPSASSSSAATPSVDVDSMNITPPTAESQSSTSPKNNEAASEYFQGSKGSLFLHVYIYMSVVNSYIIRCNVI